MTSISPQARPHRGVARAALTEDYLALRGSAGGLNLERDVLRVSGPDAREYLQGQCSQDLSGLANGSAADSLVLSPQGKLDALVRVIALGDDEFLVDVRGGYGEQLEARLNRFKLRVKAQVEHTDWRCVAVRGPGAAGLVHPSAPPPGTQVIVPYEWNGVVGVDLIGEDPRVPEEARVCAFDALESVRVEAGIPEMGAELDGKTIAAEADLVGRCVSLSKGCYTGQELVARLDARGNRVSRRLRGLVLSAASGAWSEAASGVSREGSREAASGAPDVPSDLLRSEVMSNEKVVGSVTSVAWSPSLSSLVALAYLQRGVTPPCSVELAIRVGSPSGPGGLSREGTRLAAEARELPLV